mgnify:CR=1 FL=1
MRSLHSYRLLISLLLAGLLLVPMAAPVYSIEGGSSEPCMIKCAINFFAFFIAPLLIAGFVIFIESRRRQHSTQE